MDITDRHPATQSIMRYFEFDHLPAGPLRDTSEECHDHAYAMLRRIPADGPELTTGLRKLLEAKDCFVRAALDLT